MILVLKPQLDKKSEHEVLESLAEMGVEAQLVRAADQSVVVLKSDVSQKPTHRFNQIKGVAKVVRLGDGYPLVKNTKGKVVTIGAVNQTGSVAFGDGQMPVVMAGPCSVESQESILENAAAVKQAGASILRAGAFKPRTSPYDFQGLKEEGLRYLYQAGEKAGLPVITEVMSVKQVELVASYCDILQIGTRNMYNYELLKEVGRCNKPVLLKRGMSATIDEFLYSCEYILKEGNESVILCERGIRTFETKLRNTLDLSAVPLLKSLVGLPVVVDPSHATGNRAMIRPMSRAAIACGADGLLLEVHNDPDNSISDAEQAISHMELSEIVKDVYSITFALNADAGAFEIGERNLVASSGSAKRPVAGK